MSGGVWRDWCNGLAHELHCDGSCEPYRSRKFVLETESGRRQVSIYATLLRYREFQAELSVRLGGKSIRSIVEGSAFDGSRLVQLCVTDKTKRLVPKASSKEH
jgi:hypothetical protein